MLLYSIGNHKIGRDTLIINMGSAQDCPSNRLGLCSLGASGLCYALKTERYNPNALPYYRKQAAYWKRSGAGRIIKDLKGALLRHRKIKYIRFNEAGDFYGQGCINKLSLIAEALKGLAKTWTYTHRKDLNFSGLSDNLTVNGSGFMVHNNFKTVAEYSGPIRCGGDCRTCKLCLERSGAVIECKLH